MYLYLQGLITSTKNKLQNWKYKIRSTKYAPTVEVGGGLKGVRVTWQLQ